MNRPLKWHKFLIYCALWLAALSNLIIGAGLLIFGMDGDETNPLFQIPAVMSLNVVYGVVFIAYAVYCIYTRFQLARFKTGAPKKLLIMYIIYPVIELVYAPLLAWAAGMPMSLLLQDKPQLIGSIIGAVIGIGIVYVPHKIYYDKRKELFVN